MNESSAKATLRQLGIAPTPALIRNWMRAAEVEHRLQTEEPGLEEDRPHVLPIERRPERSEPLPTKPRADGKPQGSSNSNLEPVLIEQSTLERSARRKKPGRPRIIASWFPAVAQTMADGTSLRTALAMNRLYLTKTEIRALYRNVTFKAMYQETRRRFLIEHFGRRPILRERVGQFR